MLETLFSELSEHKCCLLTSWIKLLSIFPVCSLNLQFILPSSSSGSLRFSLSTPGEEREAHCQLKLLWHCPECFKEFPMGNQTAGLGRGLGQRQQIPELVSAGLANHLSWPLSSTSSLTAWSLLDNPPFIISLHSSPALHLLFVSKCVFSGVR